MNIPIAPEALDAAMDAETFTGVLTVDVGDERALERCGTVRGKFPDGI